MKDAKSIKSYISKHSGLRQERLKEIYQIAKAVAPRVTETIKYGMPTLVGKRDLFYFAAMKGHLGFYPTPSAVTHFAVELAPFGTSKGCVRFPYDKPLPKGLITKMMKFRIREDTLEK